MTPKKPKFPKVFQSAEEEAAAAGSLCRYIENIVFVGEDEAVTEIETKSGRFVILEAVDEPAARYRYLFEGTSDEGDWRVVVRSEGEHPNEICTFEEVGGSVDLLRSLLDTRY